MFLAGTLLVSAFAADRAGLNFVGQPAFVPQPISSLDTVGWVPQRFWNNGFGAFGTSDLDMDSGDSMSVHISGFTASWNAPGTHVTDTGGLMGTFINSGNDPGSEAVVEVRGVPEKFRSERYAVVVYFGGGLRFGGMAQRVTKVALTANAIGQRTLYGLTKDAGTSDWTIIPASSTADRGLLTPAGNVMVFTGLEDETFTLTVTAGTTTEEPPIGVLNAFQIVPMNALPQMPEPPVIGGTLSATGTVGTAFNYVIAASAAPTSYQADGLPFGLTIETSTGLIGGTPMEAGQFSVTLTARNGEGAGLATLNLTIHPAPLLAEYELLEVGSFTGETRPTDLNDLGQVVGYGKQNESGATKAFLFSGSFSEIVVPGAIGAAASAINNAGQIVGSYTDANGKAFAVELSAASPAPLISSTFNSVATDINENGEVIGFTERNGGEGFFLRGNTRYDLLAGLQFNLTIPHRLNERADVVGMQRLSSGTYPYHAVVWSGVSNEPMLNPTDIGHPGFFPTGSSVLDPTNDSVALHVNNRGQVVGTAAVTHNIYHAFLFENGAMLDLGVLPGFTSSQALAINDAEEIVGSANETISGGGGQDRAFLWTRASGMRDLNSLIAPDSGWILLQAIAINARGQIAAIGQRDGSKRPVLLSPRKLRPALLRNLETQTVTKGAALTLSVVAIGTGDLVYQWRHNGSVISGATDSALVIADVQLANAGRYSVVISDAAGTLTSKEVLITVLAAPEIETPPLEQTVLAGDPVRLEVRATGTLPLEYQWQRDEKDLPGATTEVLEIANAQLEHEGNYRVVIRSHLGSVTSDAVKINVLIQPKTSIATYAGITIEGQIGRAYRIDRTENPADPSSWQPLTTLTLTNRTQIFFDLESPAMPKRFYRAVVQK
ncbi:MAG: immunoglobulin domain-containing protein [Verrucomicrobiota bacterium]